ncbi:hypothetical protein FRC00_003915, partial [Tulasnella sp. 408]
MAKSQDRSQTWRFAPGPSTTEVDNEVADIRPQPPSPMKAIPVEIFETVILEVVKESLSLSIPDYYNTVTRMRLVCRRWTRILEGMPEIWTNLSLDMDQMAIDLVLSRSMHSPLTVRGHLSSSPILDKLLQHTYRWKNLDVSVAYDGTMDRLAPHSVPLLEELRLSPSVPTHHIILFKDSAPMLRIVSIRFDGIRRIALLCLGSLELNRLDHDMLKQIIECIEAPMCTKCLFSLDLDGGESEATFGNQRLEPLSQRLIALAEVSRGTKSTFTLCNAPDGWEGTVRVTYESEADRHGTLTVEVDVSYRAIIDAMVYFAHRLGQCEPNPVRPALRIVNPPHGDNTGNELELLQRLHNHLPDTEEIMVEDPSSGFIKDAFDKLFPSNHSFRLFPQLSVLIVRASIHEDWAEHRLQRQQKRQDKQGGFHPLSLQTLRIEGGTISTEMVKGLESWSQTWSSIGPLEKVIKIQSRPACYEFTLSSPEGLRVSQTSVDDGERLSDELQQGEPGVPSDPPQPLAAEEEGTVSATYTQPQLPHPIDVVPLELFQMILWEVVNQPLGFIGSDYYYAITRLRLVCRRWTQVLEGMPEVWDRISLTMDEMFIDLALSRSMRSPLSIDLTGYEFSSSALDKLLQHIHRWEYLAIHDVCDSVLEQLAVQSFPILEELMSFGLIPTRSNISFSGSAPMLRTVHISRFRIQWNAPMLSNLRELALRDVREGPPDIDTFLNLLSNSPKLTRLEVWNTHVTQSSSPLNRVSLLYLQELELENLTQDTVRQLLGSVTVPTSTTCRFGFALKDPEEIPISEQLEPIGQRLTTLAETSKGTRSILTLCSGPGQFVRAFYEGESDLHGELIIWVQTSHENNLDILEYFASQLSRGEPTSFPPVLRIVDQVHQANFNKWELLLRLDNHLPNTEEIQIEHGHPSRSTELAFNTLFLSNPSSPPFSRLSTLVIRGATDTAW